MFLNTTFDLASVGDDLRPIECEDHSNKPEGACVCGCEEWVSGDDETYFCARCSGAVAAADEIADLLVEIVQDLDADSLRYRRFLADLSYDLKEMLVGIKKARKHYL